MFCGFAEKTRLILGGALLLGSLNLAHAESIYNRGNRGDMASLDYAKMQTVEEAHVARDIFEGLTEYDAHGNFLPAAAESWTISPDGLVYTFKLRENAKWSNGDPVTAGDFVYAWRREEDPATAAVYATILYPVKNAEEINTGKKPPEELGVRAVDDYTLEVTLKSPTPYFLELMTHFAAYPLNRTVFEKYGADWVKTENIVSNGPYKAVEFIPKDHVKLVKNPFFREADKVKIDVVNYIPFEDTSSAIKRFEAGELDSFNDAPAEQMNYIRANLKDQFMIGPMLGTYYYALRCDKPPFDNIKLRRALALAVDREYLSEKIWRGLMLPAYSLVPPGITGYKPSEYDFKNMSQLDREDEARKIMAELGYGPDKPLKLEIRYNTGENHKNTAVAIADMFKRVYVETTLTNTDGKTHYSYMHSHGDFDIARSGWNADYKDPQTFIALGQTNDSNNYSLYSNKEVDAFLEQAAAEPDAGKRMEELEKAEEILLRENPMIILLYYTYHDLVSKKLHGFEENVMDIHPTRWISKD